MNRYRAWLQLVRVPNLCTAAADVTAGYLFVGGGWGGAGTCVAMIVASVFLYAGGVVLNDFFDASRDAVERPGRPIPSGAVSHSSAGIAAAILLAGGAGICWITGGDARWLGLTLAVCVVLYDGLLKATMLAPGTMGTCRALNLSLGMSVMEGWTNGASAYAALLMWLYVSALTVFARHEATGGSKLRLQIGTIGVVTAVLGLAAIPGMFDSLRGVQLLVVGMLAGVVAMVGLRAMMSRSASDVQAAVKSFVLALVLLDGCLVFMSRGALSAIVVIAWLVPAVALSRMFRVT